MGYQGLMGIFSRKATPNTAAAGTENKLAEDIAYIDLKKDNEFLRETVNQLRTNVDALTARITRLREELSKLKALQTAENKEIVESYLDSQIYRLSRLNTGKVIDVFNPGEVIEIFHPGEAMGLTAPDALLSHQDNGGEDDKPPRKRNRPKPALKGSRRRAPAKRPVAKVPGRAKRRKVKGGKKAPADGRTV